MLSGQHSPEPTNLFVLCHRVPGEMNWGNRKSTSIGVRGLRDRAQQGERTHRVWAPVSA